MNIIIIREIKTLEEVIFQASMVINPDITEKNVRVLPHDPSYDKSSHHVQAFIDSTVEDEDDESIFSIIKIYFSKS